MISSSYSALTIINHFLIFFKGFVAKLLFLKRVILIYGKRVRDSQLVKQNSIETHQLDGQGQLKQVSEISRYGLGKKKKLNLGNVWIFSRIWQSLKSGSWIFHSRI